MFSEPYVEGAKLQLLISRCAGATGEGNDNCVRAFVDSRHEDAGFTPPPRGEPYSLAG